MELSERINITFKDCSFLYLKNVQYIQQIGELLYQLSFQSLQQKVFSKLINTFFRKLVSYKSRSVVSKILFDETKINLSKGHRQKVSPFIEKIRIDCFTCS